MMDFEAANRIQRLRGELASIRNQAAERIRDMEAALGQARAEVAQARQAAAQASAVAEQAQASAAEAKRQASEARKQALEAAKQTEEVEQRQVLGTDSETSRKRLERAQTEQARNSRKALLSKALLVLDNLARAMEYEHTAVTDPAGLVAGLRLTYWQLNDLLEGEGLRPVETVGRVFDPKVHEAVDIDVSGKSEPGIVTAELQKGWYYENEVLRPARVTVAGAVPRRHSPSERA